MNDVCFYFLVLRDGDINILYEVGISDRKATFFASFQAHINSTNLLRCLQFTWFLDIFQINYDQVGCVSLDVSTCPLRNN